MKDIVNDIMGYVLAATGIVLSLLAMRREDDREIRQIDREIFDLFSAHEKRIVKLIEQEAEHKRVFHRLSGREMPHHIREVGIRTIEADFCKCVQELESKFGTDLSLLVRKRADVGAPITIKELQHRFGNKFNIVLAKVA